MGDGKLANLIQITNQKIDYLNSHLESHNVNEFYTLPPQDPTKNHVSRMIHDLDYLIANSNVNGKEVEEPYLAVRDQLLEIKSHLSSVENSDHSTDR